MDMLAEAILRSLSRDPSGRDYPGGTVKATPETALNFLIKTVPGFADKLKGAEVLDFGCGHGLQALAMGRFAKRVVGLDLPREVLQKSWSQHRASNVEFRNALDHGEQFDVVISCSSFEHFADPAAILDLMRERTRHGGTVIISFAEPWYSPRGAHMDGFTRVPWVNLLFPEKAVLSVRALYRKDGARRYEDVEGGLNRMTLAKFERLMRNSRMQVEALHLWPVKGLPLVSRLPVMRELLTAAASCVLRKV